MQKAPYGAFFVSVYLAKQSSISSTHSPFPWLINIRHDPFVDVRVGRIVIRAKASIIESSDYMYKEMWAKAVSVYNGFNEYKKATTRNIPIVVLHRVQMPECAMGVHLTLNR